MGDKSKRLSREASNSRLTKKQLTIFFSSGLLLFIFCAVSVYMIFGRNNDVRVLSVGDVAVYRTEYNKTLADAKKYGVDTDTARKDVIQYYKAKQVVADMQLNIPSTLVDSKRFVAGYGAASSGEKGFMPRGDWVAKKAYVLATEVALMDADRSGVAINIITRPYSGNMNTSDAEQQIAKDMITYVRKGIDEGVDDIEAVNAVRKIDTTSNAIVSSDYQFVSSYELEQETNSITSGLPPEGRGVLRSMKDGELSKVIHADSYDQYILIRKLYSQKGADIDVQADYEAKLRAVRVVEYDK
jgi:hypothetical protein